MKADDYFNYAPTKEELDKASLEIVKKYNTEQIEDICFTLINEARNVAERSVKIGQIYESEEYDEAKKAISTFYEGLCEVEYYISHADFSTEKGIISEQEEAEYYKVYEEVYKGCKLLEETREEVESLEKKVNDIIETINTFNYIADDFKALMRG